MHVDVAPIAYDDALRRIEQQQPLRHMIYRGVKLLPFQVELGAIQCMTSRKLTHDEKEYDRYDRAGQHRYCDQRTRFRPPAAKCHVRISRDRHMHREVRQPMSRQDAVLAFHLSEVSDRGALRSS